MYIYNILFTVCLKCCYNIISVVNVGPGVFTQTILHRARHNIIIDVEGFYGNTGSLLREVRTGESGDNSTIIPMC